MGQVPSLEGISEPCTVTIPNQGTLTGVTIKEPGTLKPLSNRFTQVRYGLPQEGEYRFRRPRPLPEDYDYTGEYTEFGIIGAQPVIKTKGFSGISDRVPTQEDIAYLNIWVPASDKNKPEEGWPVVVFYHGGFLQYGKPNHTINFDPRDLQNDENFEKNYIIVAPGYRVSMFGFLNCQELLDEDEYSSNVGFWDQRLALEWVSKYIKHFGGNPDQITCSGRSAGSYSTFFQLCYELYHPEEKQIIKQVAMISNALTVQPKGFEETQLQFDEIIEVLGIDKNLPAKEKLAKLREVPHTQLEDLIPDLKFHTFRAVTDDKFISSKILKELDNGEFAKKLTAKGIRIVIGEVSNEYYLYSKLNTPTTYEDLKVQLNNYYPEKVINRLLEVYPPVVKSLEKTDPEKFKWQLEKTFGDIVSDLQVCVSTRGFLQRLHNYGFPLDNIFRYRVDYRPKLVDRYVAPEIGVPHASENQIWFYSKIDGFLPEEEPIIKAWMKPFTEFYNFEAVSDWAHTKINQYRLIERDGTISVVNDDFWNWGVKVSNNVYDAELN